VAELVLQTDQGGNGDQTAQGTCCTSRVLLKAQSLVMTIEVKNIRKGSLL